MSINESLEYDEGHESGYDAGYEDGLARGLRVAEIVRNMFEGQGASPESIAKRATAEILAARQPTTPKERP
jgi:hypothetical protein